MKKSAEIRQELAGLVNSQNEVWNVAKTENRSALNEEETRKFNEFQTQIDAKANELRIAEQAEANQRLFGGAGSSSVKPEERELANMKKGYSVHRVMGSLKEGRALDGVEGEMAQEYAKQAREAGLTIGGIAIPMGVNRADGQTVTQDSAGYGGALVQTDVAAPIEYLRPKLVVEQLGATYLRGLVGNLKFPKNNGGISTAWEGEVDAAARTKAAYGSITLTPKRLASSVLVSIQNLAQTGGMVEMLTINEMNRAIAQALDAAAINGPGTGDAPTGILNTSGIGSVAGGTNGAAPTWANMVALESKIFTNNADAARMGYLINAVTRGKLKTTEKVSGYPQYIMADNGQVNGYNAAVTNLVPSDLTKGTASGICSAAIFGDFSQLLIGSWAFADLTIDRVTEIESGYHKFVINSFNDVQVRHAESFAAIKDLLTT